MRFFKLLPALAALSLAVQAQTPANFGGDADIQQMKQQIADLESKLSDLNQKVSSTGTADSVSNDAAPTPQGSHAVVFHGVSDVGFGRPVFDALPPNGIANSADSFNLGDLDLYTSVTLSEKLKFFAEMLVTSDFSNEFSVELDRAMMTYTVNDYLKVTAGKFNTALGYYSNAFNRARYFQTATGRPIMYTDEDDGGILPVHSVGFSATGLIPSGKTGLHWVAEVSNGRSFQPGAEPVQNFADLKTGKAINVGLFLRPEWLDGLQVGSSFYRETAYSAGLPKIDQTVSSFYAVYVTPRVEILNEAAMVTNSIAGASRGTRPVTGYSQFSRKIGSWRPYVRYDYQNVPASDPLFGYLGRENGPSVGVRYQIAEFAGLKLQYGRLYTTTQPAASDIQVQIAFSF